MFLPVHMFNIRNYLLEASKLGFCRLKVVVLISLYGANVNPALHEFQNEL
jgi:hypothetical protein